LRHKKRLMLRIVISVIAAALAVMILSTVIVILRFSQYIAPVPTFSDDWSKYIHDDVMADLYVSTSGSDENDGTRDSPFLTIERAMKAVRDLDKTGREEIIVGVEEGMYYTKPLALSTEDGGSDSCRIRYVAIGEVTINLGTKIDAKDFVNVACYPDVEKRINKNVRERIMVVDLTSAPYGLTDADWGKLYPIGTYNTASRYQGDTVGPMYSELFIDDKRQILARYPNNGYLRVDDVVFAGRDSQLAQENGDPMGDIIKVDQLLCERISTWQNIDDVWMYGFPRYDWADSSTPLSDFNPGTSELTTKYQSFFGVKEDAPYYFYNCLEELDAEGEWYLDRENGLLCIYASDSILDSEIILATSLAPIIDIRCNNISFEGFTITGTRGDGIIAYGNNITLANCTVKSVSGSGIFIEGFNNEVYCCELFNLGRDGIAVSGGERSTLSNGNNRVYNNLIHDWAEVYKTYRAGININGIGNICANNELYGSPHLAITYSGNNNIIEYNLIHDVCLETDDSGAIYAGKSWTSYGNEIRYNCIYNLGAEGHSPNGIYMDDAISGQFIYGNILINIPQSAIFIGGGRDMSVFDNLIINCGQEPIFYDARAREATISKTWFTEDIDALLADLYASPWQSDAWQSKIPEYNGILSELSRIDSPYCIVNPANSVIRDNVVFHKKLTFGSIDKYVRQHGTVNNNSIYHLSMLSFFFEDMSEGKYIPTTNKIVKLPISKIGRY